MNVAATFPVQVAGLDIDPLRRRVAGPGGEVALEPLVMRLLLHLVDRQGQVLPRRELFAQLWGNAQVGDDSLNRLIAGLRRALATTSNGSVAIETVPRVGYRLVVGLSNPRVAPAMTRRRVIGTAASLVLVLGGTGAWNARRESRLAQAQRWTDRGDMLLRDGVPLQTGDALTPLRLALELDPNNGRALGLLALTEEIHAINGGSTDAGESLRASEQAARAALQRDPNEPHARLAMIELAGARLDWAQMEEQLEALRAAAPANVHVLGSLTSFLQAAGRTSRSWVYNEQAAVAAPISPTPQWRRALRLWTAGRDNDALSLIERVLPLWPRHAMVWNARFMILAFSGRTAAARAMLRDAVGPAGSAHPVSLAQWLPTLDAFDEPSAARIAKAKEANLAAARLNPGQATHAAMVLSQLGEIDAAFAVTDGLLLSKGPLVADRPIVARSFVANSPSWCRTQWLFMPPVAALRRDPRYQILCEQLGLSRYWRQRGGPDSRIPG